MKSLILLAIVTVLATFHRAAMAEDERMQTFLKEQNCIGCHALSNKVIGPSFKDISLHYTSNDVEYLTNAIRNGGNNNLWGPLPSPASLNVSKTRARCIALWMLSLNPDNKVSDPSCRTAFQDTPDEALKRSQRESSLNQVIEPEMVVVPAGKFVMGSPADEANRDNDEGPPHLVTIAKPFEVSKYEVTWANWDNCIANGGCKYESTPRGTDERSLHGNYPVVGISWVEAHQYTNWLSNKTGKKYRLLTEAEWEYAARAGTTTAYYWGKDIGSNLANCRECGNQLAGKGAMPVGGFSPNQFGLYDMLGNVAEMTEDTYQNNYKSSHEDGSAQLKGGKYGDRVVRGGSWYGIARDVRSAFRDRTMVNSIENDRVGFRIARTLP